MKKSLLLATLLATLGTAAHAGDLAFSAGSFDVADGNTPNFGLEYRGDAFWYDLEPMAGVQVNTDGGIYGYAGLNYDWMFTQDWYLTPNAAVGLYEDNSSEDLGGAIEFRTGVELAYAFESDHRLGLAFHHISNAGIYDDNPGAEQVMLTYSIPLSR